MRTLIGMILLGSILYSCKKYEDPKPFEDDRINQRKYCNDPSAVNFNWGFPGIPDNTTCIYPSDLYKGQYMFYDSTMDLSGIKFFADSFLIDVIALDSNRMQFAGFCPSKLISVKSNRFLRFTVDTLVGTGQSFCNPTDTISGFGQKQLLGDSTRFTFEYEVFTPSGYEKHAGVAIKK